MSSFDYVEKRVSSDTSVEDENFSGRCELCMYTHDVVNRYEERFHNSFYLEYYRDQPCDGDIIQHSVPPGRE